MNRSRRKDLGRAIDLLSRIKSDFEEAKGIVEQAASGERDYYDNMPENMQSGDKGSDADNAATQLEEVVQSLEEFDLDDLVSKIDDARGQ